MRRRTLLDLIQRNLDRDPRDAPALSVEADCAAQDMAWMPDGVEPERKNAPSPKAGGVADVTGLRG